MVPLPRFSVMWKGLIGKLFVRFLSLASRLTNVVGKRNKCGQFLLLLLLCHITVLVNTFKSVIKGLADVRSPNDLA